MIVRYGSLPFGHYLDIIRHFIARSRESWSNLPLRKQLEYKLNLIERGGLKCLPQPSVTNPVKALLQPLKIATGNSTLIAGWKSPSSVFVPLRGNTTLGEGGQCISASIDR
jgi:hypothetical protein